MRCVGTQKFSQRLTGHPVALQVLLSGSSDALASASIFTTAPVVASAPTPAAHAALLGLTALLLRLSLSHQLLLASSSCGASATAITPKRGVGRPSGANLMLRWASLSRAVHTVLLRLSVSYQLLLASSSCSASATAITPKRRVGRPSGPIRLRSSVLSMLRWASLGVLRWASLMCCIGEYRRTLLSIAQ